MAELPACLTVWLFDCLIAIIAILGALKQTWEAERAVVAMVEGGEEGCKAGGISQQLSR